jgi:hypothetical protein
MAATNTYALGKAAESYFFTGQRKKPLEFRREAKQQMAT